MKPVIFRDDNVQNFGDELNIWLWDRLLNEKTFRDAPGLLMGIGTLLEWGKIPEERPLIVFGSGAGYGVIPSLDDVDVRFVRGPRSARVLGKKHRWITDPAILVGNTIDTAIVRPDFKVDCAFMPHWTTAAADSRLEEKMADLGIGYIDPTKSVDGILRQISASKLLVTEALHGAVVADALRIPWIPALLAQGHTFKWFDWCESMGIQYNPVDLNVVGVHWARDNWPESLSNDVEFSNRLIEIQRELDTLRFDIELGKVR